MPQIIRDSKQDQALETISIHLGEIGKINAIIASGDYSFKLQSVGGSKAKLDISPAQNTKVIAVLKERKKELVKEAKNIAKANKISFNDKEEFAMTDAAFTKKQPEATDEPIEELDELESLEEALETEEPEDDDLNLL